MTLIERIQDALRREKIDGWLFFDHHRRDPLAYKILEIPDHIGATRRWYYFVPAVGEPRKLVHRIETGVLDALPGERQTYARWMDQEARLQNLVRQSPRIAMQYSPRCSIPYVSLVDAGTLEMVRGAGVQVVSSADLVQQFEARWTEEQFSQHLAAGKMVDGVRREAFQYLSQRLGTATEVTEYEIQQFILERFADVGLVTDHGPIIAVNANASDPHYEPRRDRTAPIQKNDLVLIDLWAKLSSPSATYYDVTWIGFCGETVPEAIQTVFEVVRDARKKASAFVISRVAAAETVAGYEVDDEARAAIDEKGFGEFFFHRTGHSIGTEVHGAGANMDNLESHDERRILSRTCFSIEPGVYLPNFGIRSEVNVYVGEGFATVTGEEQEDLVRI